MCVESYKGLIISALGRARIGSEGGRLSNDELCSASALAGEPVKGQLSGARWKGQKVKFSLAEAERDGGGGNVTTCTGTS